VLSLGAKRSCITMLVSSAAQAPQPWIVERPALLPRQPPAAASTSRTAAADCVDFSFARSILRPISYIMLTTKSASTNGPEPAEFLGLLLSCSHPQFRLAV
jgi:hypothetical protein